MNDTVKRHNTKKPSKSGPTLEETIAFLQDHPQLIKNEMNPYSAEKLMMLLDNEKLAALEDEFDEHPNGIELPNFVLLLKCAIVHPAEDKYKLVNGLIKLFQDIDINGDGQLEWSEFTQYIIDAVIGEKDAKFFDARFEKDRELTENEVLDKAYSRKTKRYVMSKIADNTIHPNVIKKVGFCSFNDLVYVLEQNMKKIKFYNLDATIRYSLEPSFEEKAFVIDACYSEALNLVGCVTSDRKLIIWENNPSHRESTNIKTDVLMTGIWFLENHKVWVTAGADNILRTHVFGFEETQSTKYDKALLISHTKKITEVVEITIPKLIASSSLDGTIKLWDLADKFLITELKDSTTVRGIRGITYSYDYGGNLLSYGFEYHISVWCPEVSLTRSYIGKLTGHSSTIVSCKFIPKTPNCVSADEKGNIRIWDIRSLSTIQLISGDQNGGIMFTDVAIIQKYDKFVMAGKRLNFYDNSAISKSLKNFNEDVHAIHADFNHYYQSFVIMTKIDVRVYDILTGKLKKVFTDLNDERGSVDLSAFCYGGKQRKFYVGDNSGHVRVYNMKTGELIKRVNSEKEELEFKENFLQKNITIKKKENNEISKVLFLTDEKLLITASWDSIIRIYDETEPQESMLLRIMSGGHRDSDISALAYSAHLNLLASGSGNGIISVWDFESGKLESILLGHNGDVTCLQFADPFPILISGSSDGSLCVWAVRPATTKYKYKCLLRVMNSYWIGDEEKRAGINTLDVETGVTTGIPRKAVDRAVGMEPGFPTNDEYHTSIHKMEMKEREQRNSIIPTLFSNTRKSEISTSFMAIDTKDKEKENKDKEVKSIAGMTNVEDVKSATHINQNMILLEESIINPLKQPDSSVEIYELMEDFKKYQQTYDHELSQKKMRCYIYYGDQKGFISLIEISEIIKKRDIFPVKSEKKSDSYQMRRKDWIDASKTLDNMFKYEKKKIPFTVHSFNTVLIKRWEAHQQAIQSVVKAVDPLCYVTCSPDKHVKLFTVEGDMLGDINLVKLGKGKWKIPFDWVKYKLNELDEAFEILKKVEKEESSRLSTTEKDLIRNRYLLSMYCGDKDFASISYMLKRDRGDRNALNDQNTEVNTALNPRYKFHTVETTPIQPKSVGYNQNAATEIKETKKQINLDDFSEKTQNLFEKLEKYDNEHGRESSLNSRIQPKARTTIDKNKNAKSNQRSIDSSSVYLGRSSKRMTMRLKASIDSRYEKFSSMSSLKQMSISHHTNGAGTSGIKEETTHRDGEKSVDKDENDENMLLKQPRQLFHGISSTDFRKNMNYTNTLAKSYSKPQYRTIDFDDIKFRIGEGSRTLKLAAKQQITKFDSQSPEILGTENDVLQRRSALYKSLRSSAGFGKSKLDGGGETARTNDEKEYKIVANKLFMNDPNQNKPRILKNNGRLYVL